MITDPLALLVVLAAVVTVALWLAQRYRALRALGAALLGILMAMLLSNLGIIPGTSPTYDLLHGPVVSVGIALILLSVDIRSVMSAGPMMLAAFAIGAIGTATGAITGALLTANAIGPETWKLAGQFTGTYTGGGLNFAALGRAFDTSSALFTGGVAADVTLTAIWMAACLTVPLLLGNEGSSKKVGASATKEQAAITVEPKVPRSSSKPVEDQPTLDRALENSVKPVPLTHAAAAVTIAVGAVWLAGRITAFVPFLPEVLWLTTVVLLVAQIPPVKALVGGALWGNYLLLLFLASNGAQSVIANIFRVGPAVFWFALITLTTHGLIIFGIGRLMGIDTPTLTVASQANVGGPASAIALASARGYSDRLLPGAAVGLLGYAVGNYTGFLVGTVMRSILGA